MDGAPRRGLRTQPTPWGAFAPGGSELVPRSPGLPSSNSGRSCLVRPQPRPGTALPGLRAGGVKAQLGGRSLLSAPAWVLLP